MNDFDSSTHQVFKLMQARAGTYDKKYRAPSSPVEGVKDSASRINNMGGHMTQNRMIKDKYRSFQSALYNSYQAADIQIANESVVRALINPDKLKQDYDDKIVSVDFAYNYAVGDVFEWCGTGTHWLIYLQDSHEFAYFRGYIRKCSYTITFVDEDGNQHTTYAAIRGPKETRIDSIFKHDISMDIPNYSVNLVIPQNEQTRSYFKRYAKIYLNGVEGAKNICWRIEAIDAISSPYVMEIDAVEYYANEFEDDIENGVVGALIEEPTDPNTGIQKISGETFIRPKKTYTYTFSNKTISDWIIDSNLPISYTIDESAEYPTINLKWNAGYSGQFVLKYDTYEKTIVVESLF